ncbi:hypothetical protein SAMD00019534_057590 [Acytostelium subglobosum LB1]|uniref:hypothetical protein n=1 Tax=Acytostelium subglobosum LB1 TaxID=1410327 RepID=UPI0006449259|nr:hypothetical protein SAMD00019534_057590 [Acytostelium subglobosum LB1]GAM22584.1 hypothetical protein SAMD00019534_057590 [Acytostelium subglobosum LB1]|eukprot:XP_012754704.1 hypothetical protein SAMD00019534_057590 [Acytostelium subglobosum LB1]
MSKVKFVEVVPDDDEYDDDDQEAADNGAQAQSQSQLQQRSKQNDRDRVQSTKASQRKLKSLFKPDVTIGSVYTGGPAALSTNSAYVVTCCSNKLCFVSTRDGVETRPPLVMDAKISAFALSPANDKVVVALSNLQMHVYDISQDHHTLLEKERLDKESSHSSHDSEDTDNTLTSRSLIRMWKGQDTHINSIDFHSSGGLIATGASDGSVRIWDVDQGYCTHNLRDEASTGVVSIVKFHPNTLRVVAVSDDCIIRVWNLTNKSCMLLENHMSVVSGIAFSNSSKELISAGRDKVLNLWDLKTGKLIKTVPIMQELGGIVSLPQSFYSSDVMPDMFKSKLANIKNKLKSSTQFAEKIAVDDVTIVIGGYDVMRAWCMETGECIWNDGDVEFKKKDDKEMEQDPLFTITNVLNNGDTFAAITSEHNIVIYDYDSLDKRNEIIGYNDEIVDIKYINANEIAVATNSNEIRCYDLTTKKSYTLRGHSDLVMAIDVSHDGKQLVSASRDNTVRLWDLENQKCLSIGKGHTGVVTCIAMSKKGANFALSGSEDRTIKLWKWSPRTKQLEVQATIIAHEKDINSLNIAPNDKIFASGSQDSFVKLWNVSDLKSVASFKAHKRGVWNVEFSPVDQCIMSASADGTIKIWSLKDMSCLKTFEGHNGSVLRASFITFGMQIVSVGADGLVKLWTIKTNECVNTFESHDAKIWALAMAPGATRGDQQQFITGSSDSKIIIWNDHTILEEEKVLKEKEEAIKNQQSLDTSLRKKDYRRAIKLSLILNQPNQTLRIFQNILETEDGQTIARNTLNTLPIADNVKILKYVRDWNTNSKFVEVAQTILQLIITLFHPSELTKVKEMPQLLESLIPYNERHFQRIDRILQKTYLLDFTIASINPAASDLLKQDQ